MFLVGFLVFVDGRRHCFMALLWTFLPIPFFNVILLDFSCPKGVFHIGEALDLFRVGLFSCLVLLQSLRQCSIRNGCSRTLKSWRPARLRLSFPKRQKQRTSRISFAGGLGPEPGKVVSGLGI